MLSASVIGGLYVRVAPACTSCVGSGTTVKYGALLITLIVRTSALEEATIPSSEYIYSVSV